MFFKPTIRVLVIDDDASTAAPLAAFLSARRYEVWSCSGLSHARDMLDLWRPHVLVLAPHGDAERHADLGKLRRLYPRLPVVVLTVLEDADLLLDLEAFAPTLPAMRSRGLGSIESAVAVASHIA
jgi:DNA-binding response OmpR family regulator